MSCPGGDVTLFQMLVVFALFAILSKMDSK